MTVSECDKAGICQYDRQCPFYAENCRHTEPKTRNPSERSGTMTPQKIPTSGRNDHEDLVIKKCRDCNGTGKGTVPGSRCGSCGGSGQSVTVVHRR